MLIKYYKGQPNLYVIRYKKGQVVTQGSALEFWYMPFNTSIAVIPTVSQDVPFIFHEETANFQQVSIQGLISYRISNPEKVSRLLDFTINPATNQYLAKNVEKLSQRVVNAMQDHARRQVNTLPLEKALTEIQELSSFVLENLTKEPFLVDTGVIVEGLHFSSVQASPEMKEALEAQYRESLKRQADKAIYDRRAASVEEERKIRQSEVQTEIDLEERRKSLVKLQAENDLKEAETKAKSEEMMLALYEKLPPQALIGLGLKDFAGNAKNISNLAITPDLLGQAVHWMNSQKATEKQAPAAKK